MICDKKTYKEWLKQDYLANDYSFKKRIKEIITGGGVYSFLKTLRKLEYAINTKKKFYIIVYKLSYLRKQKKFNCVIPPNVFGYGLRIEHLCGIIVNPTAKIGNFCNIHQFVTIGNNGKVDIAATVGDNCYFGAGAIVVGKVTIGSNVIVGAGSVVTKSIPDKRTVAGVPARELKDNLRRNMPEI